MARTARTAATATVPTIVSEDSETINRTRTVNYYPFRTFAVSVHKDIQPNELPSVENLFSSWADANDYVVRVNAGGRSGKSNRTLIKVSTKAAARTTTATDSQRISREAMSEFKKRAAAMGVSAEDLLLQLLEGK